MGKFRLGLASHGGTKKGVASSVVLVEPTHEAIATAANNKLKLKLKNVRHARLFLKSRVGEHPAGTELPLNGDLSSYIENDTVVTVSIGGANAPAAGPSSADTAIPLDPQRLPPLPRLAVAQPPTAEVTAADEAPGATAEFGPDEPIADVDAAPEGGAPMTASSLRPPPPQSLDWEGAYPVLEGGVLPLIREAIAGCDAFTESNMGDYICFDYKSDRGGSAVAGLFPPVDSARRQRDKWLLALRRECRGLLLCSRRGVVIARRFHKFFNLSERPETEPTRIELNGNATVSLKLDGSLCSPVLLEGELCWATRSRLSQPIASFAASRPGGARFVEFGTRWLQDGWTPLFEWCEAARAAGVVQHECDSLTLLSMRHTVRGHYMGATELDAAAAAFNIP
eukprot:5364817-Prymnesium_polylepis.1